MDTPTPPANPPTTSTGVERARPYAYYALFVLVLANLFNYLDRQIISVLAPAIQKDLEFTDAQLGFLLGTAFAVLYGVVGIPMGRIADAFSRTRLMAGGLALWSAMTVVSGLASGFIGLGAARIGVGVGEATANPVSHSLLSEYFPARNRATVLSLYLASVHIGIAIATIFGGLLIQHWSSWCSVFPGDACSVPSWRAGFFFVGLPGLLLAVLVALLREPARVGPKTSLSARTVVTGELAAAIPPFTLFSLYRLSGPRAAVKNAVFALAVTLVAIGLSLATGDWAQWIAVAVGVYSVSTWAQVLRFRDLPLFKLTFGCPTFMLSMFGGAFVACFIATIQIWGIPYAMRTLHEPPGTVGVAVGLVLLSSAAVSIIMGGLVTDRWKRYDRRAPIWIALIAIVGPVPLLFALLHAQTLGAYVAAFGAMMLLCMSWGGAFAALVQDLVLPRMRGAAAATFSLVVALISSGIGPYWTGKISTMTGSLTTGLYAILIFVPPAVILLVLAARRIRSETPQARLERARAAGEPV